MSSLHIAFALFGSLVAGLLAVVFFLAAAHVSRKREAALVLLLGVGLLIASIFTAGTLDG